MAAAHADDAGDLRIAAVNDRRRPVPPGFTGGTLDRADRLRGDPDAVWALMARRDARLLLLDRLEPPLDASGALAWSSLADLPDDADPVLLGLDGEAPRFACVGRSAPPVAGRSPATMRALALLPPGDAATYAAARSLVDWHLRHRFCAACGTPTDMVRAGWSRRCPSCAAEHFPRTDPVVIMLAEHDDRVLLGRAPGWPEGRYSALAGFAEVGEAIEDAVAREVWEETGVRVTDIDYVASQPWPFPSSLMIGCVARAADDAITLDTNELADAIWVPRAGVQAALAGEAHAPFLPPPPYAIAHTLLAYWADE